MKPESRAEYFRKYRKTRLHRAVREAKKQGREDLRIVAITLFRTKLADREMNGLTVARMIEMLAVD